MYSVRERVIIKAILDDEDFQNRLFDNFSSAELRDLAGTTIEMDILHKIYGSVFDHYVNAVYEMFGETRGDILLDLRAKMTQVIEKYDWAKGYH